MLPPTAAPMPQQQGQQQGVALNAAPALPQNRLPLMPNARPIALLLPLSGANAALAQPLLNGAQLAVFELADPHFMLQIFDTGQTPPAAVAAYQKAVQAGAQFAIGPLFAAQALAIRPLLRPSTPILTFSNDLSLADPLLHVFGVLPAEQAASIARHARRSGYMKIAALIKDDAYGKLVQPAFADALRQDGALGQEATPTLLTLRYQSNADIPLMAQKLAAQGQFDALFLPAGGSELPFLLQELTKAGVDLRRTRLLGTGLWDEPELLKLPALQGGRFAGPPPTARAIFNRRYMAHFGLKPTRLASLAYDAVAMAAVLARSGPIYSANLYDPQGFAGTDGLFRIKNNFFTERSLAILEVQKDQLAEIELGLEKFDN